MKLTEFSIKKMRTNLYMENFYPIYIHKMSPNTFF